MDIGKFDSLEFEDLLLTFMEWTETADIKTHKAEQE